jgi:ATP-binding cassette subfamily F protein 3
MKSIQATNLQLAFGDRTVLKDVQIAISTETRAALTGGNGSGKSTLMKILNGSMLPDGGEVTGRKTVRVAYLPQGGRSFSGTSLHAQAEKSFHRLHDLAREKRDIEHILGEKSGHNPEVQRLLEKQHELEEELLAADYYNRDREIEKVLTGLGFPRSDFDRPCEEFSGGWQMRIALAGVLLEHPDILLLDEPTNYLDLEARNWLEDFLLDYRGGFLLVSHDRFFLDTTVKETYELFMGRLTRYPGNYSAYLRRRSSEMEELARRYEQQQQEIERLNAFISRFRYNASKARQVQSRVRQLEKIEPVELPEHMKQIHFSFPPAPHSGKLVLELQGINKFYGPRHVIRDLDLQLKRGEKLVVTGLNGAGKSTLLRIMAGMDGDFSGELRFGSGVSLGYFSQEQTALEDTDSTILELFEAEAPTDMVPRLRNLLGAFLFQGEDVFKAVRVLSGGEKSRVALLRLLLQPHNLLILDEPTNHLDLHSKDVLLDALKTFDGTLVFVSHDRYFIEQLAGRVLHLEEGTARDYPGGYSYYLYRLSQENPDVPGPSRSGETFHFSSPPPASREDYEKAKQKKNRLRRLEAEEAAMIDKIEKLEETAETIRCEMALPEVYSDGMKIKSLQEKLRENEKRYRQLSEEWEKLLREKEELEQEENS